MHYYGFKVHVVTDTQGLIFNYDLTPASIHDSLATLEVIEHCPCTHIIADVGYIVDSLLQYVWCEATQQSTNKPFVLAY
ncbi:transposase [Limosilactobacillus reuteri]|uniref:transposase n=1 Tax=Limosilactobacillus reuteri TaxID=1598 RepID=UPI003984E8AC|nr:transposase [Limosilactobacillus reuteri]